MMHKLILLLCANLNNLVTFEMIEKVDVKDSNIELGNELKQKFIIDKK